MAVHMLSLRLCSLDLVDRVCEIVHRMCMSEILVELNSRPGIFDYLLKGDNSTLGDNSTPSGLKNKGHEIRVVHDDYIYWWTTVVHINDSQFVMMHEYYDEEHEELVVEGFVEKDVIKIERIHFKRNRPRPFEASSLEDIGRIWNMIPFQLVIEHHRHIKQVDIDHTYHSGKKWMDRDRVWKWFEDARYSRLNN